MDFDLIYKSGKMLTRNKDFEYPEFLMAALLKARDDGVSIKAIREILDELKEKLTQMELDYDASNLPKL